MCFPAIDRYRGNTCEIFKSSTKSFEIKIAGDVIPLSSRLRENTLRYQIFDPGGHMIRSEHMRSCLTAQIRFMLFKGPGSFKKFLNRLKCWRIKGLLIDTTHLPLTPPLFFHFTLPLNLDLVRGVLVNKCAGQPNLKTVYFTETST